MLYTPRPERDNDQCRCNCDSGYPCTLSKTVLHTIHVCDDPYCGCHAQQAVAVVMRLKATETLNPAAMLQAYATVTAWESKNGNRHSAQPNRQTATANNAG
jgi:hypothetical protein